MLRPEQLLVKSISAAAASLSAVALFGVGVHNSYSATPDKKVKIPFCGIEDPDQWASPLPPFITNPNFSKRLGVSPERFRAAEIGLAICRQTITYGNLKNGQLVKIAGKNNKCLAIGGLLAPGQSSKVSPNTRFRRIVAVCLTPERPSRSAV